MGTKPPLFSKYKYSCHVKMNPDKHLFNELEKLKEMEVGYCFTAIKWPKRDHLDSFSDYDLRIIIRSTNANDIIRVNKLLSGMFKRIIQHEPIYERLFEHPPGFIHNALELECGIGNAVDIKTWSFVHGSIEDYHKVKRIYSRDMSDEDRGNLQKLFFSRYHLYDYSLEPLFDSMRKVEYLKYCLIWHYYGVSIFAAASLLEGRHITGKSRALEMIGKYIPELQYANKEKLFLLIGDHSLSLKSIWEKLQSELTLVYQALTDLDFSDNSDPIRDYNTSLAMLRTKVCRYEFYLYKSSETTDQLISREKKELEAIAKAFRKIIYDSAYKALELDIKEKFENFLRNYLSSTRSSITRATIKSLIEIITHDLSVLEEVNYKILHAKFGNFLIECLKIKINSRCTRKCSFCIFSDNAKDDMSLQSMKAILSKAKTTFYFSKIHINGGEPTLHPEFREISEYLRTEFQGKGLILGTNCTTISKIPKLKNIVLSCYDSFFIGCDDEHRNIDDVEKIIPQMVQASKFVLINTLRDYLSPETKNRLSQLCSLLPVVHVLNNVHHLCTGTKKNVQAPCVRYKNKNLLVVKNMDCFRCFNAINEDEPEFNLLNPNLKKLLFTQPSTPYSFCSYCDEYLPEK